MSKAAQAIIYILLIALVVTFTIFISIRNEGYETVEEMLNRDRVHTVFLTTDKGSFKVDVPLIDGPFDYYRLIFFYDEIEELDSINSTIAYEKLSKIYDNTDISVSVIE